MGQFFAHIFTAFATPKNSEPREEGVQIEDLDIVADLQKIQPDPIDIRYNEDHGHGDDDDGKGNDCVDISANIKMIQLTSEV